MGDSGAAASGGFAAPPNGPTAQLSALPLFRLELLAVVSPPAGLAGVVGIEFRLRGRAVVPICIWPGCGPPTMLKAITFLRGAFCALALPFRGGATPRTAHGARRDSSERVCAYRELHGALREIHGRFRLSQRVCWLRAPSG